MVNEASACDVASGLRAGAGRAQIAMGPEWLPFDGFTTVIDPLSVRVVFFEQGATNLVLVVVDQTSVHADLLSMIKLAVGDVTGVSHDGIVVVASHTFSAPHLVARAEMLEEDDEHLHRGTEALLAAVRSAAAAARAGLRPATISSGSGAAHVATNRDVLTPHGWWLGVNESGFTDPWLGVVRIDSVDGSPIAIIANQSVQSSVMNGVADSAGGRVVTDDLAGCAMRFVEEQFPGCVSLFLPGAAADQAPAVTAQRAIRGRDGVWQIRDAGVDAHVVVDLLGERLGAEVVRVADAIALELKAETESTFASTAEPSTTATDEAGPASTSAQFAIIRSTVDVATQQAPLSLELLRPTLSPDFPVTGTESVPVTVIRLGSVLVFAVQPELSAATGVALRAASPAPLTLVATMADGGAKYMADADAYARGTYAALNSRFAPGAAETLGSALLSVTRSAWPDSSFGTPNPSPSLPGCVRNSFENPVEVRP